MRKLFFIFIGVVIVVVAGLQFAQGGKRVVQVTSNKKRVGGLKVSILGNRQDGGWEISQTNEDGFAEFGTGFWSWPWKEEKLILAVQSSFDMEWEGVVVSPSSTVIHIPIDEDDRIPSATDTNR